MGIREIEIYESRIKRDACELTGEKDLRDEMKHLKEEVQTLKQQLDNMSAGKSANIKVKEMNVKCLKIKM
jgi:50S ribosomal subunit-associated GTPase HflX